MTGRIPVFFLFGSCLAGGAFAQPENPKSTYTVEWTFSCASPVYSSPVVADLTDEPGLEILIASSSERKIYCLSSKGKPLWTYGDFTLRVTSTPTLADLNGDGEPEILVTTRSDGVICLSRNGKPAWKSPSNGGIPWGGATVSDTDWDGHSEIHWTTESGCVQAVDSKGVPLWSFQNPEGGTFASLAIGNVNDDPNDEIVAAVGYAVICLAPGGKQCWQFDGLATFNTGPVLCDLMGDSKPEVLTASNDGVLYCLEGATGSPVWNHRTVQGRVDSAIAVGDIDGDGLCEVLYGEGSGNLFCLSNSGHERWSYQAGDWIESAPVLGDVDGDSQIEVVFGCADGHLYCLSEAGELKWRFQTGRRIAASPTLCDCDLDGHLNILVPSLNGTLFCLSAGGKWEASRVLWPMKRYDLSGTAWAGSR